jgi:hypothetical protein
LRARSKAYEHDRRADWQGRPWLSGPMGVRWRSDEPLRGDGDHVLIGIVDAPAALEPQRKSDRVGKVAGISGREVSRDRAQAPLRWILLEPTAPENVVFVGDPWSRRLPPRAGGQTLCTSFSSWACVRAGWCAKEVNMTSNVARIVMITQRSRVVPRLRKQTTLAAKGTLRHTNRFTK